MLLVAGGLFWWQSRASNEEQPRAPLVAAPAPDLTLPEGDENAFGAAPPPGLARATPEMREQRRFQRFDRNRDGIVTRVEMLSTRTAAFKKLDTDGNNLLSFEEWAVATANRFDGADANKDSKLSAAEFAKTAPPLRAKPKCKC